MRVTGDSPRAVAYSRAECIKSANCGHTCRRLLVIIIDTCTRTARFSVSVSVMLEFYRCRQDESSSHECAPWIAAAAVHVDVSSRLSTWLLRTHTVPAIKIKLMIAGIQHSQCCAVLIDCGYMCRDTHAHAPTCQYTGRHTTTLCYA